MDDGINEKFSESWEAGRGETAKEDKEQTDRGPGDHDDDGNGEGCWATSSCWSLSLENEKHNWAAAWADSALLAMRGCWHENNNQLQGKSSTRSSSSTTGVSVREPLNVRLQRLLSSDQSSAYTILDILQVIFLILSLAGSCPVSMEEVSAHLCASWGQIVMTVMAFRLFAV